MEAMLSVAEFAELKGCSQRYIRKSALEGRIPFEESTNSRNRKIYQFPVSTLPAELQQKYYEQHAPQMTLLPNAEPTPLDRFSSEEREEIMHWQELIEEWQEYRKANPGSAAEVDEKFVLLCQLRGEKISKQILYRRWKALREQDYKALVDMRGKARRGRCKISEPVWQAFLSFYLDQAQHPIRQCYLYTELWAQQEMPQALPLPDYTTFYRHIQSDVPEAVEVLGREGEKAFNDRCAPYIRRCYNDMRSNEWWIADNHTFDIISQTESGQKHRLYLTAFFDARSGIFTGCYVTDAPSSQSTLIALRKGILKYGIPDNIYVDNGHEFLTYDVGGLGHRRKASKKDEFVPPPIFQRLGIKMTNAIVRNAKAKIIERRFLDIKNQLSRLFETFTGGTVVEKPECLKTVLKDGKIPVDGDLTETINTLLEYYFNRQPYGGAVASDRGKQRMQVYNEQLIRKRVAGVEDLNLMLMRSTRPQTVTRRGVKLPIAGQQLDYWTDDMVFNLLGKKVYIRYDPDDLSEVRIYDLQDRYIMNVPVDNTAVLKYGSSSEEVAAAMRKVKRMERIAKEAKTASVLPQIGRHTALELVLAAANSNKDAYLAPADPKVLEIQRAEEHPLMQQAVGSDIDMALMARNASRNIKANGGCEDEDL